MQKIITPIVYAALASCALVTLSAQAREICFGELVNNSDVPVRFIGEFTTLQGANVEIVFAQADPNEVDDTNGCDSPNKLFSKSIQFSPDTQTTTDSAWEDIHRIWYEFPGTYGFAVDYKIPTAVGRTRIDLYNIETATPACLTGSNPIQGTRVYLQAIVNGSSADGYTVSYSCL